MGKFHFRGKKLLFGFIILTMIIPGTTMIVPQFELATHLGLVNRLWGLIPFYVAWVIPFSTFMIKGFMEGIPDEITEATYIDGASVWTVYTRISLPLAAPAICVGEHLQLSHRGRNTPGPIPSSTTTIFAPCPSPSPAFSDSTSSPSGATYSPCR